VNRFLRDRRCSRGKIARLFFAFLAFAGTQAAFVRGAFPHVSRTASMHVVEQSSDAPMQSSLDEGRLPSRAGRRGGPTVGTSAPVAPEAPEWHAPARTKAFARSLEAPPTYVPPSLFRPPRAG